jgi:hypothetical protein
MHKPVAIFENNTPASDYFFNNIVYKSNHKLLNHLKQMYMRILGIHPDIGGGVILESEIHQVTSILKQGVGHLDTENLSCLCVCTSNPVYLVFKPDSLNPDFAVHIEKNPNDDKLSFRKQIYRSLPDNTAAPIGYVERNAECFFIEEGVPGKPWFRIANRLKDNNFKKELASSSKDVLLKFQHAISEIEGRTEVIYIKQELISAYSEYNEYNISSSQLTVIIDDLISKLDFDSKVIAYSQHGDFCINNLLIGSDLKNIVIIDFEDFGKIDVPLFDEFSLALSFYMFSENEGWEYLSKILKYFIEDRIVEFQLDENEVDALFFIHLFRKMGKWSQNRQDFKIWLEEILQLFLLNINSS